MGTYQQEERKKRIKQLRTLLFQAGEGGLIKNQLIASLKIQFGLRREKIEEYLSDLEEAGYIVEDGGILFSGKKNNDEMSQKEL